MNKLSAFDLRGMTKNVDIRVTPTLNFVEGVEIKVLAIVILS